MYSEVAYWWLCLMDFHNFFTMFLGSRNPMVTLIQRSKISPAVQNWGKWANNSNQSCLDQFQIDQNSNLEPSRYIHLLAFQNASRVFNKRFSYYAQSSLENRVLIIIKGSHFISMDEDCDGTNTMNIVFNLEKQFHFYRTFLRHLLT